MLKLREKGWKVTPREIGRVDTGFVRDYVESDRETFSLYHSEPLQVYDVKGGPTSHVYVVPGPTELDLKFFTVSFGTPTPSVDGVTIPVSSLEDNNPVTYYLGTPTR